MAKQVLLNLQVGRINELVAGMYPQVVHLAQQLDASPDTEKVQQWQSKLYELVPVVKHAYLSENRTDDFDARFMRRLDLVRNGAHDNGGSDFTPIAAVVAELANQIESSGTDEVLPDVEKLPDDVIEAVTGMHWRAEEMRDFLEDILRSSELLSEARSDWESVADRAGFAEDEKWQVVITPKITSLSVDGEKKVMFVPESFDKPLVKDGGGALPVAAHEYTHVLQNESSSQLAQTLPLAK